VKFDSLGVKQWSSQFGTVVTDAALAVVLDSTGNIYVGGITWGDMSNMGLDGFVAKFDASGTRLWIRYVHTPADDTLQTLAVDGNDNVVVAGYTHGDLFGVSQGNADFFVAKFDGAGNSVWGVQHGTSGLDRVGGVVADAEGNVLVAGFTSGDLDGNFNAGDFDILLVKYDAMGVRQWTRQFGGPASDVASALAFDSAGNLYLGARTSGLLDGSISAQGRDDGLVIKFDTAGNRLWTRQAGSAAEDFAMMITVDGSDRVVLGGYTMGAFDGNAHVGGFDAFLVAYDAAGTKLWSRQVGTAADDFARGIGANGNHVFVVGDTLGSFEGASGGGGASDMFVLEFDGSGKQR
jgi:hypothetical protein